MEIPKELDELCYKVIGVCMEAHNELGPGFPEEYYQKALELEFTTHQISYEPQKPVVMLYKGTQIGFCNSERYVFGVGTWLLNHESLKKHEKNEKRIMNLSFFGR